MYGAPVHCRLSLRAELKPNFSKVDLDNKNKMPIKAHNNQH